MSRLRFGAYVVDLKGGELLENGRPVKLALQPFKVLRTLVLRSGEVVSREELRRAVWGEETHVDFEGSLHSCIKQIRAALGDDASAPRFIETLPRRGYRFLPEVSEPARRAPMRFRGALGLVGMALVAGVLIGTGRPGAPPPPDSEGPRTLVVLPEPEPGTADGAESSYRGPALAAEMTRTLSGLDPSRLEVIAASSASHPELASREVDYRLSLRADADALRVTLESRGHEVWRGDAPDIASLAAVLVPHLLPEPEALRADAASEPNDPEAYEAYLKARYHLNRRETESLDRAERYAREAVALADEFASAHVALAEVHIRKQQYSEAESEALRALELDPSAEGHFALALARWYGAWDWAGAGESFQRALLKNPGYARAHHWYAYYLTGLGRHDEAIAEIERAVKLDPLSPEVQSDVGWFYYFAGRFEEAVIACERTLELEPGFPLAKACLYESRLALGETSEFREQGGDPYVAAISLLRRGELEAATESLARAIDTRSAWVPMLAVDPRFEPLRADSRNDYERLLRAAGFP